MAIRGLWHLTALTMLAASCAKPGPVEPVAKRDAVDRTELRSSAVEVSPAMESASSQPSEDSRPVPQPEAAPPEVMNEDEMWVAVEPSKCADAVAVRNSGDDAESRIYAACQGVRDHAEIFPKSPHKREANALMARADRRIAEIEANAVARARQECMTRCLTGKEQGGCIVIRPSECVAWCRH